MFVRMLKLADEARRQYDLSSQRVAIHAAAPCPIPVKEQMIAWWGPILYEYYAGTEGNGVTAITSAEWLADQGFVGRGVGGGLHHGDDVGHWDGPRRVGDVSFPAGPHFAYRS